MLKKLHNHRKLQYVLGLLIGFLFGFLLQKGGVCSYDIIMRQLLLQDFTVMKIILTAIVTGMLGVYAMRETGWVVLHKKAGSLGTSIPGPLIFGIGFAALGYCPGTSVGAVGHGALDALVGGVVGITIGAGLYAAVYPVLKKRVLHIGGFGEQTFIDLFHARNPWFVIIPFAAIIVGFMVFLERMGY
ncbi:MAG: YeeE/YedE thiosulfate transporter family protein [Desulforhopalus sp.]